jgi:hypothetical protein
MCAIHDPITVVATWFAFVESAAGDAGTVSVCQQNWFANGRVPSTFPRICP